MGISTARRDVQLDPITHDVVLVGGDVVWTAGSPGVRQAIKIAVLTFLGEIFYDQSIGVPWIEYPGVVPPENAILGSRYTSGRAESVLAAVILAVPDVGSLISITSSFERSTRTLSVAWVVATAFGDQIADTATIVR